MHDWVFFEKQFPVLLSSLRRAKQSGSLGHAYLVVSSNPDYRTEFPLLLSCLAVCSRPAPDGTPCLKCENCSHILNGLYPDAYTLAPTSKAREITIGNTSDDIDTLRWFESLFHLSAGSASGWKIGTVQEADTMNESAQNAFLKTLEEPPGKCLFILTTGRAAKLLPTIRSRCQILYLTDNRCVYDFPRCGDVPGILARLVEPGSDGKSLLTAADCAMDLIGISGSLYDAAVLEVEEKWTPRMEQAKELESAGMKLLEKRVEGETGSRYRRSREQFMSMIHTWCALLALRASGIPAENLPNAELSADMDALAAAVGQERAFRILDQAEQLLSALRSNVNDELALRTFCLNAAVKTL